jgi:threonylcarbamoyladenosine tRNA methylthiotransferase MtaB
MPTVAFATLGCRLNQADTQGLQGALEARGYRLADDDEAPDVVVVNTCTVTVRAEASDRQMIRRFARAYPSARLVVTGCWAQTDPDTVADLPGVDLVVGNGEKHRLPDLLDGFLAGGVARGVHVSDVSQISTIPLMPLGSVAGRSRAFLKVQEGCQHRCAFCIVPRARGASRSQDPTVVLDQIRFLAERGHREVTLTGVDLGSYGADLSPRTSLAALLRKVVDVRGLRWIRLSSLLPAYFTRELLDLIAACPLIAPHLHVPLQSGSDRMLRRMRRPYTTAMYRRLVERLIEARPELGLGADLIVGHPTETESEFTETMAFVDLLPFSYLHVFPYSDRKGTEAAVMAGHVDRATISSRSRALRQLASRKNRSFRGALAGSQQEVLVLETRDPMGCLVGLTGNYVEVTFDGPDRLMRSVQAVRVTEVGAHETRGELV